MAFSSKYTSFLEGLNASGKTVPGFRYVQPSWGNFQTGLEMKRGLATGLGVGALAFGVGVAAYNSYLGAPTNRSQIVANAEDVGSMGRLNYDAVANASNGSRDLGATGELVFGLNNARRGRR